MSSKQSSPRPFEVKSHDKSELRKWVEEQFPELSGFGNGNPPIYPSFEERFDEIHRAAMTVLNRIMRTYKPGESLHEYYLPDLKALSSAFDEGDKRKYAKALEGLTWSIEYE